MGMAVLSVLTAGPLHAQVSTIATTPPTLSPVGIGRVANAPAGAERDGEHLSLRINTGATQILTALVDNTINRFTPVSITTQWDLATLITAVDLVGYFFPRRRSVPRARHPVEPRPGACRAVGSPCSRRSPAR
jgi:hypothetical protein